MDNPFQSKGKASPEAFCDRDDVLVEMIKTLKTGTSVALAASRRSGKSWMAQTLLARLRKEGFLTAYLDLIHVHSPLQWIERFAGAVLNSISATPEELFQVTRRFLPSLNLSSVSADAAGYRLRIPADMSEKELSAAADQIYTLPRLIAKETGKSIAVCMDEYPEILSFLEPHVIERLKKRLHDTKDVVYLLASTRPKLIEEVLGEEALEEGLVRIFHLRQIPAERWEDYILGRFRKSGFTVDRETAAGIVKATHGYSYYTQLVCAHLWSIRKASRRLLPEDSEGIADWVLDQEDAYFEQIWRGLTKPRKSFLAAVAQDPQSQVFSSDFRAAHRLPPASTLQAVVKHLEDEGLIERNGTCRVVDPFFQEWLRRNVV
ncbi:MAG: hypothetical protein HY553_14785 [Elusimicrobia bacterium]|nr:hypothetical protein [Elusimicrobiota bacterium]